MSDPTRPPGSHRASRTSLARAGIAVLTGCLGALLTGCALPPLEGRSLSQAIPPATTATGSLGKALTPLSEAHPELSGIVPLTDAQDAFAARVLMARAAQHSLDVQYYIWRGDTTGQMLLHALYAAAERGVRVRLLLDDNGISGMDAVLATLDTHPNIEVRLFNPFSVRSPKALGFITHFSRANRRMHNKSFTADNQATIVGGRNVGDEYFGATDGVLFADLDVLAVGAVVPQVSEDFDRYWASASTHPVDRLIRPPQREQQQRLLKSLQAIEHEARAVTYARAVRESAFLHQMISGKLDFQWSPVHMVSDDPRKGLGLAAPEDQLPARLAEIVGTPERQLDLVSPYFVPGEEGTEFFTQLAARGVRVRVLTNALEATDVAAVHSGYQKRRPALLQGGVSLYELRRNVPSSKPRERAGLFGSSGSSLHAKTFASDNQRLFVGSFNFDPRSDKLNTELGFVIENPALATALSQLFDTQVPKASYRLEMQDGGIVWHATSAHGPQVRTTEPGTTWWQRTWVHFLARLPIEWLL